MLTALPGGFTASKDRPQCLFCRASNPTEQSNFSAKLHAAETYNLIHNFVLCVPSVRTRAHLCPTAYGSGANPPCGRAARSPRGPSAGHLPRELAGSPLPGDASAGLLRRADTCQSCAMARVKSMLIYTSIISI